MSTEVLSSPKKEFSPRTKEQMARAERSAKRFWVSGIVFMLGLQVVIGVTSIVLSVGDPSVAIIPNYHQAALDWDVTQRARHLTQTLQWQVETKVSPIVDQTRTLQISIFDKQANGVPDLLVSCKAFHHARGSEVYDMRLTETEAGVYEATTRLVDRGLWQLQLQFEGEHGIASDQRDIAVP